MSRVDIEGAVEVAGTHFSVVGTPATLAARPALLIHLTFDARHGLDPIYLSINRDDRRMRTEDCVAFHRTLRDGASNDSLHTLRLDPGDTHSASGEGRTVERSGLRGVDRARSL